MSTPDISGNRWALGAACYKTSSTILFSITKCMSKATNSWQGFIVTIKSLDFSIKRVQIDNDSVFLSAQFMQVCQDGQIVVERIVPYAYWQLARIKRQWKTLSEEAKTLLLTAKLLDTFWGHAFMKMGYSRNRIWLITGANVIP
jgi:hypothetical protein